MLDKKSWRQKCLEIRRKFCSENDSEDLKSQIASQLGKLSYSGDSIADDSIWASYKPIGGEANPCSFEKSRDQVTWSFPRVEQEELGFYCGDDFEEGAFRVLEPVLSSSKKLNKKEIHGFLIPGLAFDRQGHRLGWGKGHYDRALKGLSALKVGLSYSVLFFDQIPAEEHDIAMDYIVTEKFVYSVGEHKKWEK